MNDPRKIPRAPDGDALAARVPPGAPPGSGDWLDLAWFLARHGSEADWGPLLLLEASMHLELGPGPWAADVLMAETPNPKPRSRSGPELPGATGSEPRSATGPSLFHPLLEYARSLPALELNTRWLRQLPREDGTLVFTGNLQDVFEAEHLEEATLRLSRVLRVVQSGEYGAELLLEAGAWDRSTGDDVAGVPPGMGLRAVLAVLPMASWGSATPEAAERGRALLTRWLCWAFPRRPNIPFRFTGEPGQLPASLERLWQRAKPLTLTKGRSIQLGLESQAASRSAIPGTAGGMEMPSAREGLILALRDLAAGAPSGALRRLEDFWDRVADPSAKGEPT